MHKLSDASTTISTVLSSFDGEDGVQTESIVKLMDFEHFSKLRHRFFGPEEKSVGGKPGKSKGSPSTSPQLSRTEFVVAVEKILGWSGSGIGAAKVFDQVDTDCKGFISWEDFLDHTISEIGARETQQRPIGIFSSKAMTYHQISQLKKADTICKIITMKMTEQTPNNETIYAMVSSGGLVVYCDENLGPCHLESSYRVPLAGTEETVESLSGNSAATLPFAPPIGQPRSKISRAWITDAILMEDINVIVFATSDRCLHFRDVEGRGFPWLYHVTGLRYVPTSLAYWHSDKAVPDDKSSGSRRLHKEEESRLEDKTATFTAPEKSQDKPSASCDMGHSVLLFGDDGGNIRTLKFLRPNDALFHRSRRKGEGAERIHWLELEKKGKETVIQDAIGSVDKKRRSKSKFAKLIRDTEVNLHEKFVEISVERKVHSDAVSRLSYRLNGAPQAVVSCSSGDRCRRLREVDKKTTSSVREGDFNGGVDSSLRLQTPSSQALPYVFRVPSGICCFDLWEPEEDICSDCENFLLATGSSDGLIRLWNPYVTKLAVGTLAGHGQKIVDLMFLMKKRQLLLISVCVGAEVRVWKTGFGRNPENASCLQVVPLNFPALGPCGRKPGFGSKALYAAYQGQRMKIMVSCCAQVATLCFAAPQSLRDVLTNEEEEEEDEREDTISSGRGQQRRTKEGSLLLDAEAEAVLENKDEGGDSWIREKDSFDSEERKGRRMAEQRGQSLNDVNSGYLATNPGDKSIMDVFAASGRERIFQSALRISFSSSPANSGRRGPHAVQSLQQIYRKEMRKFVSSLGAPHLALPLHPPAQVNVRPSLDRSKLHSLLSQI